MHERVCLQDRVCECCVFVVFIFWLFFFPNVCEWTLVLHSPCYRLQLSCASPAPPAAGAAQPPANWTREQRVHRSATRGIMHSSGRRDSGRNECLAPVPKDVCSERKKNLVAAAGVDLQCRKRHQTAGVSPQRQTLCSY